MKTNVTFEEFKSKVVAFETLVKEQPLLPTFGDLLVASFQLHAANKQIRAEFEQQEKLRQAEILQEELIAAENQEKEKLLRAESKKKERKLRKQERKTQLEREKKAYLPLDSSDVSLSTDKSGSKQFLTVLDEKTIIIGEEEYILF